MHKIMLFTLSIQNLLFAKLYCLTGYYILWNKYFDSYKRNDKKYLLQSLEFKLPFLLKLYRLNKYVSSMKFTIN